MRTAAEILAETVARLAIVAGIAAILYAARGLARLTWGG